MPLATKPVADASIDDKGASLVLRAACCKQEGNGKDVILAKAGIHLDLNLPRATRMKVDSRFRGTA
jgi:hypothetical protein